MMSGMITAEVALAIALVAGAGWLIKSFQSLARLDPGFAVDNRLVVEVRPARVFSNAEEIRIWSMEVLRRVREVAGDEAVVGAASAFPLRADRDGTVNVELNGEDGDPSRLRSSHRRIVTPDFFQALGASIVSGRAFGPGDRVETERVVIVNEAFVRQYLGQSDPLVTAIAFGFPTPDRLSMHRIVGVVKNIRYKSLAEDAQPTFYLAHAQAAFPPTRSTIVVAAPSRQRLPPTADIRSALASFDPGMVLRFDSASDILDDALGRQKLGMALMLSFGVVALILAAIGVYGVVAYAVAQRTNELGLRIALGASRQDNFWLIARMALRSTLFGLAIGLGLAYAGGRLVAGSIFEMRASDPAVLVGACAAVVLVTAFAAAVPAVRAIQLDPVRALRPE